MRKPNKPWTEDDSERLKAMVAAGVSATRAAVVFNQTIARIRERARQLGAPFPKLRDVRRNAADKVLLPRQHD